MAARRAASLETRPNGTGSSLRASTIRPSSPCQNPIISSTWARTSGGPQVASGASSNRSESGQGAPAWTAGRRAASRARPASMRSGASFVAMAAVWHDRRSMGGHITRAVAGRPAAVRRLAAQERRDDRDPVAWRGQPGRRPCRRGRLCQGGRLPAARRHRPRGVLGGQCPPGRGLLPRPVGVHARRLQRARDEGPRPGVVRHGPERHPLRLHGAADAGRRDRRARPRAWRRRPRHRLRRPGRGCRLAGDHLARRGERPAADRDRRRRGRRPAARLDPYLRRGPALLRRPARLPRGLRPRLSGGQATAGRGRRAVPARGRPLRRQRRARRRWTASSTSTATSWASPS